MSGMKRRARRDDTRTRKVPRLQDTVDGGDEDKPLDLSLTSGILACTSQHEQSQNNTQPDQRGELSGNNTYQSPPEHNTKPDQPAELSENKIHDPQSQGSSQQDQPLTTLSANETHHSLSQNYTNSEPKHPTSCERPMSSERDRQQLASTSSTHRCESEVSHTQVSTDTCIGMTGGHNSGTVIGRNYGSVIGKQEFHEDEKFKNICRTSEQLINLDDPDPYVSTYAERSALRYLKQFGSVFIKGTSGSGKSRLGLRLLAEMQNQTWPKRTPVVLTSPAQWDLILKDQGRYTVLIDDIFGSSNIVQSQVDDWVKCFEIMWPSVKADHIFLVITSKPEISAHCENRLKRFSLMKNKLWIDEGVYQLRDREKMRMLRTICGDKKFDKQELLHISRVKTKLGFPQCCKYFASSKEAQTKGVAFFENPHEYIVKEVNTMQECGGVEFLCLLLVLITNSHLTEKHLTDSSSDIIDKYQQYCRKFPEGVTLADIKHNLESLCGVYLRKHEASYQFKHQSIYDAVFISLSTKWPEVFISMCPEQILLEFVTISGDKSDTVICIKEDNYASFADKITEFMLSSNVKTQFSIVNHPSLKNGRFIQYLFDRWSEQGRLIDIINKKCKFCLSSEGISLQMLTLADIRGPECHYLSSLIVMKKLHKLVNLLLSRCQFDVEVLQEMLVCAISVGNNDLIQSLMKKEIEPDKKCLKALCLSKNMHKNITEKIVGRLVTSRMHVSGNLDTSSLAQWESVESLKDLLLKAVIGQNSHFITILVTMLKTMSISKDFFEKCLIHFFTKLSTTTYMNQQTKSKTVRISEILLDSADEVDGDYLTWLAAGHPDSRCLKMILKKDVDVWETFSSRNISRINPKMMTSLDRAVLCGGHDCLSELLRYIRIGTHKAVMASSDENSFDIVPDERKTNLIREHGKLLLLAAEKGDDRKMRMLIETGMPVSIKDSFGDTSLHKAVQSSSFPCVKILLASHADVNATNKDQRIPLLCTKSDTYASIEIVKELIKAGSNVNHVDGCGNTALNLAVINNDVELVKCLVEKNADLNCYSTTVRTFVTPTMRSLTLNESIIPQDLESTLCGTALQLACHHSDVELVQFLCEYGAKLNVRDEYGRTVIHRAARSQLDAVEKLLYLKDVQNVLLSDVDGRGKTALFSAVRTGDSEVVAFLINEGLDINNITETYCSVLTFACCYSNSKTVRYLLEKGADPCLQDKEGRTVLHYAPETKRHDIIKLLIEKRTDPSVQDKQGRTALHYATMSGDSDCMKLLIENGADPRAKDKKGMTALHYAGSSCKSSGKIELLVEKGADPCVQDNSGKTALHCATQKGSIDSIELLLEIGSLPNVKDEEDMTALHYAALRGDSDRVKLLLEHGADPCARDKRGMTALHFAAYSSNRSQCGNIKLLVEKGADPCVQNNSGKTALHCATQRGSIDSIELLLKIGSLTNVKDDADMTALHYAARRDDSDCVKLFLECAVDPCAQDKNGMTALHYAVERNDSEGIKLFLKLGTDPSIQDQEGRTALHYACAIGVSDSVKLLLENK